MMIELNPEVYLWVDYDGHEKFPLTIYNEVTDQREGRGYFFYSISDNW